MLCVNFTQIIGTLLGDHMAVRKSLSSGLALCFSVCTTPQKEIAIPQSTKEQVNFWDASFLRAQPASAAPHQAAPTQNLIITPIFQDTAEYDSNSHSTTSTSTSTSSFYHFCVINNLSEATINHIFMRLRSNSFTMVMITGSLAPLGQVVDLNSPMNALTSTNAVASTFNPACNRLTTGVGKTKSTADDIIKEQFSRNNMVIVVKQLNMIDIEQLAPYKDQVRFFLQQNRASWPIRQAIYSLINHKEQQAQMTAVAQLAPQQTPEPQTAPAAQVTQVAQVAQVAQVMAPIPQQTVQIQVQNPQPIPQQLQQPHPAPIAMTIAPQARSLPPHRQMQPLYPQLSTMRAPLNPMPQIQTQIQTQVPMQPAPTPQRVMQAPMQVTMQTQAQPKMQMQQQSPVLMPVQHGLQATTPQNIMQAPPAMSITPAASREALHLAPVRAHAKVALEQQLNDSIFDLPSSEEVLNLKDIGDAAVAAAATAHANENEQSVLEEFTTMMRYSVRASKRAPEISISTPISSANWNSCNQTDEIEDDGDTEHPRQMAQKQRQRQKQDQAQEATNSNKPCYHSGVSARGHGDIRCLNGVSEFQRWPAITISSCLASTDRQHQDESGRRSKPSSYSNHDYCGLFGCDTGSYTDFGRSACNQRQAPYLYLCYGCSASDSRAQANAAEKRLAEEAIQWPQLDHQSVLQTKAAICWSDSTVLPSSLLWRGSSASGWLLSHSSYSIHLTKEAPHASPLPLLQVQSVAHRAALAPAREQVQTYMKKQTTATAVTSLKLPNSQVIHLQSLTPLPPLHMSTEELLARQKEILQGLQEPLKPLASSTQHGRNKSRS